MRYSDGRGMTGFCLEMRRGIITTISPTHRAEILPHRYPLSQPARREPSNDLTQHHAQRESPSISKPPRLPPPHARARILSSLPHLHSAPKNPRRFLHFLPTTPNHRARPRLGSLPTPVPRSHIPGPCCGRQNPAGYHL